jgi:uncharacterized protein (DUF362 family)
MALGALAGLAAYGLVLPLHSPWEEAVAAALLGGVSPSLDGSMRRVWLGVGSCLAGWLAGTVLFGLWLEIGIGAWIVAGLAAWRVLARLGYLDLGRELGVDAVTIDPTVGSEFVKTARAEWTCHPFILTSRLVQEADVVINAAIPKRHHTSDFSCALKNHFGCTADTFRMLAHWRGGPFFDASVVEFADAVRPELTIVDARKVLARAGPTVRRGISEIKEARRLVLSSDPVAVDAYCAGLMEELDDSFHKATRIQAQLDYAERLGLGRAEWRSLAVSEIG